MSMLMEKRATAAAGQLRGNIFTIGNCCDCNGRLQRHTWKAGVSSALLDLCKDLTPSLLYFISLYYSLLDELRDETIRFEKTFEMKRGKLQLKVTCLETFSPWGRGGYLCLQALYHDPEAEEDRVQCIPHIHCFAHMRNLSTSDGLRKNQE